jgi:hypothetical protein
MSDKTGFRTRDLVRLFYGSSREAVQARTQTTLKLVTDVMGLRPNVLRIDAARLSREDRVGAAESRRIIQS